MGPPPRSFAADANNCIMVWISMIHLIARVIGVGIETADMLVNEILSRHLRDGKAVARYAGLTGSPDESGKRRREKGLARR